MSDRYETALEETEIAIGAQDPDHDAPDLPRSEYGPVEHVSHVTGIAISTFYLVAALATLYEVFSRYLLNAPTYWAFETVMVTVAAAWMLSAGYVTMKKRHIAITVIHNIASPGQRWWLDLFAMVVGVIALYMLLTDAPIRAYDSVARIEKSGSAFNSPLPMMMKSLMVIGAFMYLSQLMVNLHRHLSAGWAKLIVVARRIAAHFTPERLAAFPNVDGVIPFIHQQGCGMEMSGREVSVCDAFGKPFR